MKKMKKDESGRSMLEMLGVLAIIGVLSVGGISGYTLAMRRHRVNEVVHTAALLVVEAVHSDCVKLSETALPVPNGVEEMTAYVASSEIIVNVQFKDSVSDYLKRCDMIDSTVGDYAGFGVDNCSTMTASCEEEE